MKDKLARLNNWAKDHDETIASTVFVAGFGTICIGIATLAARSAYGDIFASVIADTMDKTIELGTNTMTWQGEVITLTTSVTS